MAKVTVAICTWNRSRLLDQTLASFQRLQIPSDLKWELIIVNNNSTDDTDAVLDRHCAHLPIVRLFEARPGKSYAANLAACRATGELLIWTDDDVRVQSKWLIAYVRAAESWPDAAFFAGPIDPWFERQPPNWICRHLSRLTGPYVIVDHGTTMRRLLSGESVFGANMAFWTSVARTFPLNERLGRIERQLIGGDDSELIVRVLAAGMFGVWVPDARIEHFNPAGRLTKNYIRRWFRDAGKNLVRQGSFGAGRTIGGVPAWALRQYLAEQIKRAFWAPQGGVRWFTAFQNAVRLEGIIQESRAYRRDSSARSR